MIGFALTMPASAEEPASEPGPIVLQTVPLLATPDEADFGDSPLALRRLKIRLVDGRWMRLVDCADGLCAEVTARGPGQARLPADGVAGTRRVKGSQSIIEAWLSDAVEREGTGILPGSLAGALSARDRVGRVHRWELPLDRAIEDVVPRLADLDGDGQDEIVVAMTRAGEGARLAVVGLRQDGLALMAESEPAPGGVWRDPVAIADLDGDGHLEIATVASGDRAGRLEVWRYSGGHLEVGWGLKGFRSHIQGTRTTGIAAIADMDGDGLADLIVPGLDSPSLRIVSFANGEVAEPYRIELPAEPVTAIGAFSVEGRARPIVAVGLADATLVLAR
ncbi:MAG: VCBS repeat-containing protein [Hyphomicrobiaceae bacterium]